MIYQDPLAYLLGLEGIALPEPSTEIGDWWNWPWSLMDYLPTAARAAGGRPSLVIWHFQLPPAC